jgi:hypothetical protein
MSIAGLFFLTCNPLWTGALSRRIGLATSLIQTKMKKSLIFAALGVAATAATSMGEGYVVFSSYAANGGIGPRTTIYGTSTLLNSTWTAGLYYAIGTVSDPVNNSLAASIDSLPTGMTLYTGQNATAAYANSGWAKGLLGYFDGSVLTIPGYTSGPITFEVVAYQGTDYASATSRGRSGSFTMTSIQSSAVAPSNFGDNGQPMPNFDVVSVPEPSTLALAGLGGVGMLLAMRRKKS